MSYCCSKCSFTAQFESALTMHHQLHHEPPTVWSFKPTVTNEKSHTVPRAAWLESTFTSPKDSRGQKSVARTSSATRLFGKLRARICRSKTLFSHPEECAEQTNNFNDTSGQSECTSKALKGLGSSVSGIIETLRDQRETFACHMCSFDSDRITVLDRHLLNEHKIGMNHLLTLVMAKTKDGLSEQSPAELYGVRQPYYKPPDEIIDDGEFVLEETVTPKIKILKHASVSTDLKWTDIPDIGNCAKETGDTDISTHKENPDNNTLLSKMQTLNECMCKFVDSSNTIKKVLTKEFDQKHLENRTNVEPYFNLGLGDQDCPGNWERAHSEKLERNRGKYGGENRSKDKMKYSSGSFYF